MGHNMWIDVCIDVWKDACVDTRENRPVQQTTAFTHVHAHMFVDLAFLHTHVRAFFSYTCINTCELTCSIMERGGEARGVKIRIQPSADPFSSWSIDGNQGSAQI